MRPCRSLLASLLVIALGLDAHATPAEVVIVLDSSASMANPSGGPAGETRFDRAKEIVADIATVVGAAGHRVALFRYRQLTATIATGQGTEEVQVEDPAQCRLATDMLVPMEVAAHRDVVRWVDGVASQTDPEVVALGDSPLYNTARAVLGFIRGRRMVAPTTSCVNAVVVFVTDGSDTCVAGADLQNYTQQLRAQSVAEDIRAFVVSFDPESDEAALLAGMGHDPGAFAEPFGFDEADALVTALASLDGRPAPEACLVSGVAAEAIFPDGVPPGFGASVDPSPGDGEVGSGADDDGCAASGGSGALAGWALALLCGWALGRSRRRWIAALAALALIGGCGDDGPAVGADALDTVGGGGGGDVAGPDPAVAADEALARQAAMLAAIPAIREQHLRPHLDPEARYAAVDAADPLAGCLALARGLSYEPTRLARRGPAGCLATGRCNSLDKALLAQECLAYHGVEAAIHACNAGGEHEARLRALGAQMPDVRVPSVDPAVDALRAAVDAAVGDDPEGLAALAEVDGVLAGWIEDELDTSVADTVDKLYPMLAAADIMPEDGLSFINREIDLGVDRPHYLEVDGERYDPVLASDSPIEEGPCFGGPVTVANETVTVTVELLVQYANITGVVFSAQSPESAAVVTFPAHERWGERVTVAITDASVDTLPEGVPPEATSNCFHGLLRVGDEVTASTDFFSVTGDGESDCAGETVTEAVAGRQLVRVILRTDMEGNNVRTRLDRVLFDRYGYATSPTAAVVSGPQYGVEATRALLPLRVDLLIGEGLPLGVKLLDEKLADLYARRDELARTLAITRFGVVPDGQADVEPPLSLLPYDWHVLTLLAWKAPGLLPDGTFLAWRVPWRLATVRRRGFGATDGGLEVVGQRFFDIIDLPAMVVPTIEDSVSPEVRLRANMALGVLATEAERLASVGYDRAVHPLNAAALYRDDHVNWAELDSDDDHARELYPLAVVAAGQNRSAARESLIVSLPDGAPHADGERYLAWWRLNWETGMAIGEMRYEGSFYGGAAAVAKYVATITYCLATQAVAALTSAERVIPDVQCCLDIAAKGLVKDLAVDWATGVFWGATGYYVGGLGDPHLDLVLDLVDLYREFVSFYDMVTGLITKPEECE